MVNHIMVVKSSLSKSNPDAVREIYRLLKESRKASTEPAPKDGIDIRPIGYSAMQAQLRGGGGIRMAAAHHPEAAQGRDLFDATTRALD